VAEPSGSGDASAGPTSSDTSLFFALVESYLMAHPSASRDEAERLITQDLRDAGPPSVTRRPNEEEEEDAASIRARQDVEFQESSRADARKQEVAEERKRAAEFERHRRETVVAQEPGETEASDPAAMMTVMVRMPLGDRLVRRFLLAEPLDHLFRWVDAHLVRLYADVALEHSVPLCSSLVSRDPAIKISATETAVRATTFAEAGVADKSVFFVET